MKMKRTNIKSLSLLLIMLCTSMNSMAQYVIGDVIENGIHYEIREIVEDVVDFYNPFNYTYTTYREAYVKENLDNPYSGDITIPESIIFEDTTCTVVAIGYDAFRNCDVTSVTIPCSIHFIGSCAFYGCTSLQSVTISHDSEKDQYCNYIPHTILWEDFAWGNGNSEIYYDSYIGSEAFYNCTSLNHVNLPHSIQHIGMYAFSGCSSLEAVIIPGGVTNIGPAAFERCSSLESVNIPEGVTFIDWSTFEGCNLRSLVLPKGLIEISALAFSDNHYLNNVIFPTSLKIIDYMAFSGCSIDHLYIPENVDSIGEMAFWFNGGGLTTISVSKDNKTYDSRDNCNAIIETATNTLVCGSYSAFIPDGIKTIGDYAFSCYYNLTDITIPEGVTYIGRGAFESCSLKKITIPSSVVKIGGSAFFMDGSIDDVTCLAITPPTIELGYYPWWVEETFNSNDRLHVLPGCKAAYEKAFGWRIFTIVEDVTDDIRTTKTENEKENIYTIDGRRMNEPEAGKINIKNGKKYIPRNI